MIEEFVHTDYKAVDKRDELGSVFGYLRGDQDAIPLVFDGKKAYGVLNERALVKTRLDPRAKIAPYVVGTRSLAPDATLDEALEVLAMSQLPHAPVVRGKDVIGLLRAVDILRSTVATANAISLARDTPVLQPGASLGEAMHALHYEGLPAVPILGEDGRVAGLVHRRDLVRHEMDARPMGRQPPQGLIDIRGSPAIGYAVQEFETVREAAPFEVVCEALERSGLALVVGSDGTSVRGILTPETVAARIAEIRRGANRTQGVAGRT